MGKARTHRAPGAYRDPSGCAFAFDLFGLPVSNPSPAPPPFLFPPLVGGRAAPTGYHRWHRINRRRPRTVARGSAGGTRSKASTVRFSLYFIIPSHESTCVNTLTCASTQRPLVLPRVPVGSHARAACCRRRQRPPAQHCHRARRFLRRLLRALHVNRRLHRGHLREPQVLPEERHRRPDPARRRRLGRRGQDAAASTAPAAPAARPRVRSGAQNQRRRAVRISAPISDILIQKKFPQQQQSPGSVPRGPRSASVFSCAYPCIVWFWPRSTRISSAPTCDSSPGDASLASSKKNKNKKHVLCPPPPVDSGTRRCAHFARAPCGRPRSLAGPACGGLRSASTRITVTLDLRTLPSLWF